MHITNKSESFFLLLGDLIFFYVSLWLTLLLRYGDIPQGGLLKTHIEAFSLLFIVWLVVFFIAGLYEKHTLILKSKLPNIILNAQVANSLLAVLFFYVIPYFNITPKTNLFIYLLISLGMILLWRNYGIVVLGPIKKQKGLLIGSGKEMQDLKEEVNNNTRYNLEFTSFIDLDEIDGESFHKEVLNKVYSEGVSIIVVDLHNEKVEAILPNLYNLIFSRIQFVDIHKVYEEIFDRVPLALVRYNWFLENLSLSPKKTYTVIKRAIDIFVSFVLGVLSLVLYPFVVLALKIEDGGKVFYVNERLGQNNKTIKIFKFRSMRNLDSGEEALKSKNLITRVGAFLRKTRIDELPQLWNVLRGDLSLIGPRPEIPELAYIYEEEVSYYNVRHLIKPGLSGWAQLYQKTPPKFQTHSEATKLKLSYDLYYIKNRSLFLDLKIVLKTIKTLLSRSGV